MPFDWGGLFSPRGAPKQRATMSRAAIDTTGMDPEMKATMGAMRGPGGALGDTTEAPAVPGGGAPVPAHNAFSDIMKEIGGLFGGKGKK